MRGAEQRSVRRDGDVRDGGSQAGQEVPLALLAVLPLDEHRLDASAQQVGPCDRCGTSEPCGQGQRVVVVGGGGGSE